MFNLLQFPPTAFVNVLHLISNSCRFTSKPHVAATSTFHNPFQKINKFNKTFFDGFAGKKENHKKANRKKILEKI